MLEKKNGKLYINIYKKKFRQKWLKKIISKSIE